MASINSTSGPGGSGQSLSGSAVDLNSLGGHEKTSGHVSRSAPEVFVFGNAQFVSSTSASIQERTGIAPHAVDISNAMTSAPLLNQAAVPTLDRLLARSSLANVFFSVAIEGRVPRDILDRLDTLASKGANVYVVIGADTPPELASELADHPSFTILGEGNANVGESMASPGGWPEQMAESTSAGELSGMSLEPNRADEVLRGTQDMIDVSGLPETSVASIEALARGGLISPSMQVSLEQRLGLSLSDMQNQYVHLLELWTLQSTFVDLDDITLYEADSVGILRIVGDTQSTASQATTSTARQAIADDVARFIANGA